MAAGRAASGAAGVQTFEGLPDLVGGLKAVPGCLGAEVAVTASGKQVIFAWFEDKKAVLRWYHSDVHQKIMRTYFSKYETRGPLREVPDEIGPIMAVASLTLAPRSGFETTSAPVAQISIELYTPLTGGIFLGGRFAPESLEVSGMKKLRAEGG